MNYSKTTFVVPPENPANDATSEQKAGIVEVALECAG